MATGNQRYWTAVCYQESMIDDWKEKIGDILQLPYAYCEHSSDNDVKGERRKNHVHILIAFPNTTTYKHALSIFQELSKPGYVWSDGKDQDEKKLLACNTCQRVINIRHCYDYLIHDTETCKKQGKHLYEKSERITGNGFDIGAYEQISLIDKRKMLKELCDFVASDEEMINFMDLYLYVSSNYDFEYFEVMASYSGLLERLTKANYQKKTEKAKELKFKCRKLNS